MTDPTPNPSTKNPQKQEPIAESPSALFKVRMDKCQKLKDSGINPYPNSSEITHSRLSNSDYKKKYESVQTGDGSTELINICGRMITRRDMGKASFAHLQDFSGKLQIYIRKDAIGEKSYEQFTKDIDLGDVIGARGTPFRTRTGELSLKLTQFVLLSKSLRPLPEKWHGLKDPETRARQRELDLIANADSREVFFMRSRIIQSLREILTTNGYLEVETPIIQAIPGGAIARPFETFHNSLKQKFFLRVAPELYLKKCLVGGFDKVFEIGRVFRNEGIDTTHNPEFTILEAYESFGNMQSMMDLTETLITDTIQKIGLQSNIAKPFKRDSIADLFKKYIGEKEMQAVLDQNWTELAKLTKNSPDPKFLHKIFDHLFTEKIAPSLTEPTFVTEFPADFSPLAKCVEGQSNIAERFELYIGGEEIANAYSELNDPQEQKKRLEKFRTSRVDEKEGNESEGMGYDESFITALEYGMPPAGGLGIGVDRLVMRLLSQDSIRNVLLFPTLKKEV